MKEIFLSIHYIVCWAGCDLPIKDRTFDSFEKSLDMYRDNLDRMSVRIEEVTTQTKVKVVHPVNIRDFACK
jgi:hypothetical protein